MKDINEIISQQRERIPIFVYYLENYDEQRVLTTAPIHVGDFVSVHLEDGTWLSDRKVLRVAHHESPTGTQVLNSFLTLADAK